MAELQVADIWGVAFAIGLMPDPSTDRLALDELADAMLVWAEEDVLDPITTEAIGRIWNDELRVRIRDGLEPLARDASFGRDARVALRELDRSGSTSMPGLTAELAAIAEPMPADPAADDACLQVAEALLTDLSRPELN